MQHKRLVRQKLQHATIVDTLRSIREEAVLIVDVQALYSSDCVDELLFAHATLSMGVFTPLEHYSLCDGGPTCLTNLHFAVFNPAEFDFQRFLLASHLSLDYAICYALRGLVPVRTQARWLSSERPPPGGSLYPGSFERLEDEQT